MKAFLKLALLIAIGAVIKTHFIDGAADWTRRDLLPLEVRYIQGPIPETGHPMLIEFWATWCMPCRTSIPHLNQITSRYKSRGLDVVGITDEDDAAVQKFLQNVPADYAIAIDPERRYFKALGVSGVPHAFLLNAQGQVVWEGHPMTLMDSKIESVLPR